MEIKKKAYNREWTIGDHSVFKGMSKTFGFWTVEVVELYKHGLWGHPDRYLEDNRIEYNVDYGD